MRRRQQPERAAKELPRVKAGRSWMLTERPKTQAKVLAKKVFPHNLRHLFARTHYRKFKDIVRLADILGHSSIDTTRIYTMHSGKEERRQLGQLRLIL